MEGFVHGQLEAVVPHFLGNQSPEPTDGLMILGLALLPELTQLATPVGIGDVLVIAPQRVEPTIQLGDQVMIVISDSRGLAEVLVFVFSGKKHASGLPGEVRNGFHSGHGGEDTSHTCDACGETYGPGASLSNSSCQSFSLSIGHLRRPSRRTIAERPTPCDTPFEVDSQIHRADPEKPLPGSEDTGQIMGMGEHGLVGDLVVGVIGALSGGCIFRTVGVAVGRGLLGSLSVATVGALTLMTGLRLLRPLWHAIDGREARTTD